MRTVSGFWRMGVAIFAMVLAGCAPSPERLHAPKPVPEASIQLISDEPEPEIVPCLDEAKRLDLATQVGQLYMVGVSTSGLDVDTQQIILKNQPGFVVLLDNSVAGVKETAFLTAEIGSLSPHNIPIVVAADQEGGKVQRLRGPGFSDIPSALSQGKMTPGELKQQAAVWGKELRKAGVKMNLAPVAGVVPKKLAKKNEPIAKLKRGFSSEPARVAESVVSFVSGMNDAGVATSVKHFLGLGNVVKNTDFGKATDDVMVVNDQSWKPFLAAIAAQVDAVMVSSAVYEKIDPGVQAVFSSVIITDTLRDKLGFDKVIIADDLGVAKAIKKIPVAERGINFITAGGDVVIVADPKLTSAMVEATIAKAQTDAEFHQRVIRSSARVLALKQTLGQFTCAP